jgi:ketosteroid isomerase-like protein
VRRLAPLLLAAVALAACGGDEPEDIEQVIRDWARAANERDVDALCNEYVTQEFAERVSGATGDNAREQCEKLFTATRPGLRVTILDVSQVEIEGDEATAVVRRQITGGGPSDQLFRLEKEDGDFRISSSGEDAAN